MLRIVRAHGWDRNLGLAKQNLWRAKRKNLLPFYDRYSFYELGYNLRPTEMAGFLGRTQLKYWDEIVDRRQQNYRWVNQKIRKLTNQFYPYMTEQMDTFSSFALPFVTKSAEHRNFLIKKMTDKVEMRPIVGGNMVEQPFFEKYITIKLPETPQASLIHTNGFYVGNNPEMTRSELSEIVRLLTTK
jgi:CDP-4-dehydro-6-deoxyglucose reductase, E1